MPDHSDGLKSHIENQNGIDIDRMIDEDFDKNHKAQRSRSLYRLLKRQDERNFIRSPKELDESTAEDVDVAIHMGCHSIVTPHIIQATIDIIDQLGYTAVALGGFSNCCGTMEIKEGNIEAAERVDENRFENLSAFEPEFALMECTACHAKTSKLSMGYRSPDFEVVSMIEFLNNRREELLDHIEVEQAVNIALHDHYDANKWMPEEEALYARELFGSLPGVDIVEMEHSHEDRLPCTYLSDPTKYPYEDLNKQIYDECTEAGADKLITFWHACNRSLAMDEAAFPVTIRNYATFIAERLGYSYRDKFKQYVHQGLSNNVEAIVEDARPVFESNGVSESEARKIVRTNFIPE